MLCCECGAEMRWTDEPITEEFKGVEMTVEGIPRHVCDSCGNDVMAASEAERLSKALANRYAHMQGLLSPDEIRAFRKSIGVSQREFERMLGVSSPTASRWESGAMQQSKQSDLLIRMYMKFPEALEDALERAEVHGSLPPKTVAARSTGPSDLFESRSGRVEQGGLRLNDRPVSAGLGKMRISFERAS